MREEKYRALQVRRAYTKEEAKNEIERILKSHSELCSLEYFEKEANITKGFLVASRRDRLRICAILARCGVTTRQPENLASEWLIHNLAYKLNIKRASAVDVALDYDKDARWQINFASFFLSKLHIY